jgi:pyridoxine 5-phosphate synthase
MFAKLSVNINKVATLRNSRGGTVPDILLATRMIMDAGAAGITVHPRADERHIRMSDVSSIGRVVARRVGSVEYNIEGDPRPDLMDLVCEVKPTQCTLVPVTPGEITSQAGWTLASQRVLVPIIERLKQQGIRVSLFVDPVADAINLARDVGANRVELYTEPFARAFAESAEAGQRSFEQFAKMSVLAHELGLGVNAGHDLDLENLALFHKLPHLAEVSIGHALISDALYHGLKPTVLAYVDALAGRNADALAATWPGG